MSLFGARQRIDRKWKRVVVERPVKRLGIKKKEKKKYGHDGEAKERAGIFYASPRINFLRDAASFGPNDEWRLKKEAKDVVEQLLKIQKGGGERGSGERRPENEVKACPRSCDGFANFA